jgi:hypothetical protein
MLDEKIEFDYTVDYWQKLKETCEDCKIRTQERTKLNENDDNSCLQFGNLKDRLGNILLKR